MLNGTKIIIMEMFQFLKIFYVYGFKFLLLNCLYFIHICVSLLN